MPEDAAIWVSEQAVKQFRQPLVEYLVSGLEDHDRRVRIMAVEMLGIIGDARSAGRLLPLLADQDRDLRTVAAQSLAMIRAAGGEVALSQVDPCGNCMIRLVAREALARLQHENDPVRRP